MRINPAKMAPPRRSGSMCESESAEANSKPSGMTTNIADARRIPDAIVVIIRSLSGLSPAFEKIGARPATKAIASVATAYNSGAVATEFR